MPNHRGSMPAARGTIDTVGTTIPLSATRRPSTTKNTVSAVGSARGRQPPRADPGGERAAGRRSPSSTPPTAGRRRSCTRSASRPSARHRFPPNPEPPPEGGQGRRNHAQGRGVGREVIPAEIESIAPTIGAAAGIGRREARTSLRELTASGVGGIASGSSQVRCATQPANRPAITSPGSTPATRRRVALRSVATPRAVRMMEGGMRSPGATEPARVPITSRSG